MKINRRYFLLSSLGVGSLNLSNSNANDKFLNNVLLSTNVKTILHL